MTELALLVPKQAELKEILQAAEELYAVQGSGEEAVNLSYYDTFDWRLAAAGFGLVRRGATLRLVPRQGDTEVLEGQGPRRQKIFAEDLPPGPLRQRVEPLVKDRVLLNRFTFVGTSRRFKLLNSDQKTVVRLTGLDFSGCHGSEQFELDRLVLAEPLRGYEKCWARVAPLLLAAGAEVLPGGYDPVAMAQRALQIDLATVAAKFEIELSGEESVDEAVRDICLALREKIMVNVDGTLADLDMEFLHDLRVNVRRTRSLLSLMKKQLPREELAPFQQELKWVGSVTGPLRDLDVYLHQQDSFRQMVPEPLWEGLTYFFEDLASQRGRVLKTVRAQLRSDRFHTLFRDWERFLHRLPARESGKGSPVCRQVVNRIITKRSARIVRNGKAITQETPDEDLHELRIEGKKFRYLLEFFRSLYDGDSVVAYLKHMKKLQNVRGDFNDCSVQKEMLLHHLTGLNGEDERTRATAAALGGLIVHLDEERKRLRASFAATFANFASEENLALMERIVAPTGGEETGESGS